MNNNDYGKIVDGKFVAAPRILKGNGYEIINPREQEYLEAGYLAVVKTPKPEREGYWYTESIQDVNGVPTQVWTEHAINNGVDGGQGDNYDDNN